MTTWEVVGGSRLVGDTEVARLERSGTLNPAPAGADKLLVKPVARALIAATLVLLSGVAVVPRAAAEDIDELRTRAQEVADRLSSLEQDLISLEGRREGLERDILASDQRIGALELSIHEFEADYEAARGRYVDSAVRAYKAGANPQLELLLSARSMSELASLAQAADEIARIDSAALTEALTARRRAQGAQAALDTEKQELLAAREQVESVTASLSAATDERSAVLDELTTEIARLEQEARERALAAQLAAAEAAEAASLDAAFLEVLEPDGSGAGPAQNLPDGFAATGVSFEGAASWYGPGFEGDATANGEIYDPRKFTAASKELPFDTWLFVSYEGRGVIVRINDRGPYVGERILDLSQAAAQAVGLSGVGWVEIEILFKTS
ncbi:MAG TPA: septal ring lytic transglycosylase RlpA family protein [Actinomycetota bacterium]|nr:septal ring lytic transglycosylase RlpA family protein [Actinomycetota bacterium]